MLNGEEQPEDCGKRKTFDAGIIPSAYSRASWREGRKENAPLTYLRRRHFIGNTIFSATPKTRTNLTVRNFWYPICLKVRTCGRSVYIGHRVPVTFPSASRKQPPRQDTDDAYIRGGGCPRFLARFFPEAGFSVIKLSVYQNYRSHRSDRNFGDEKVASGGSEPQFSL